jgi:hypothetical protein
MACRHGPAMPRKAAPAPSNARLRVGFPPGEAQWAVTRLARRCCRPTVGLHMHWVVQSMIIFPSWTVHQSVPVTVGGDLTYTLSRVASVIQISSSATQNCMHGHELMTRQDHRSFLHPLLDCMPSYQVWGWPAGCCLVRGTAVLILSAWRLSDAVRQRFRFTTPSAHLVQVVHSAVP